MLVVLVVAMYMSTFPFLGAFLLYLAICLLLLICLPAPQQSFYFKYVLILDYYVYR